MRLWYLSGSQKGTKRFFKRLLFSRKLNKQRALRAEQGPDAAGTTNQLDRYREELRAFVTRDEPQCPTPKTNSNRTSSKETSGGFNRSVQHGRFSVLYGSEVREWRGW